MFDVELIDLVNVYSYRPIKYIHKMSSGVFFSTDKNTLTQ